jgi:SAM-dependent methyltransferase
MDDDNRRGYDVLADSYADHYADELADKPLDRAMLRGFADIVRGRGPVVDLGCGPGHVGAFLRAEGLDVEGLDGSAEMIRVARARFPAMNFVHGDLRALPYADRSLAGISAAYAIVHLAPAELPAVFGEMTRVLLPGGAVLLSFHVGDEVVAIDELLGHAVAMRFQLWPVAAVRAAMQAAGLTVEAVLERRGDARIETPTLRAYVLARRDDPTCRT